MDIERFGKSTSGKLVKIGRGDAAYWAFMPHPLPPDLEFDPELVNALSDADRALGELSGLGRTVPNPHLLIGPFVRREAVQSSRIEGTQADITDLYAYEAGQLGLPGLKPPPAESDVHEVSNYVNALEYGVDRLHTLPVSLRLMREMHERLLQGVRGDSATPGEFRRSQNWIGPTGCAPNDATFVPPAVEEMNLALAALEAYLHAEEQLPPLIRIGLIHYQFEAIHPFLDGNGRIGRLLISLLLVHWNLLPLPLLYLSAYFERYRDDYYNSLLAVSERGAWREWLRYFLRGVAEQANGATEQAKRLQDLQTSFREKVTHARSSSLLLKLVDSLFDLPIVTIPRAQRVLGVTYTAAQGNVRKLVDVGILHQVGQSSYGKTYLAEDVLRLTEEQ